MAIREMNRDQFETTLRQVLSPTTPIRSAEFLRGRHRKLEEIRRSLIQPGRHIFIYGDRGVGKTSLAQTAAYEHQAASHEPILLGCDPLSTFYGIAQDIISRLLSLDPTIVKRLNSAKFSAILPSILTAEAQQTVERGRVLDLRSMNDTIAAVDFVAKQHSEQPVIVVDEFERIRDPDQRMLLLSLSIDHKPRAAYLRSSAGDYRCRCKQRQSQSR
jgi:Cdc6-like AAA superfamily ATPase